MQIMETAIEPLPTRSQVKATIISDIDYFWPHIVSEIDRALVYGNGEYLSSDILRALKLKHMQLWIAFDSDGILVTMVTEIVNYPQKKIVRVIALAGKNLESWIHLYEEFENWVKSVRATGIEVIGRKGWVKYLDQFGYTFNHVVLKKEM